MNVSLVTCQSRSCPCGSRSMRWRRLGVALLLFVFCGAPVAAGEPSAATLFYEQRVESDFAPLFNALQEELKKARFRIVFRADIGGNLARHAKSRGERYENNGYQQVRTLMLCNPWYARQLLRLEPKLMVSCPLNVSLLYKEGHGTVLYRRLAPTAAGGAAEELLWEMDQTILTAIEEAVARVDPGGR